MPTAPTIRHSRYEHIRLIAFDADDTLWDNQTHFENIEREYCNILAPFGTAEEVSAALFKIEMANMPLLGYGCKAFTLSLIENAITFTQGKISARDIESVATLGRSLLTLPATPLPEVVDTLRMLRKNGRYKMVVFTKGELLDQQNKLVRSGLREFFDDIIVVADKTQNEYTRLCDMFDTDISHLLMVGNSFRSDIEPVLQLGGYAIHIPFHLMWKHEKTDEYEHDHLCRIGRFRQLAELI